MIALLFALALGGQNWKLSGPLSVSRVTDKDYGVVCYTLIETFRGVVGFSCVHVSEPTTLLSRDIAVDVEDLDDDAQKKPKKSAETAQ